MRLRYLALPLISLSLALPATAMMTDGFTVVTTEQARRQQVQRTRPSTPNIRLLDHAGREFLLGDWIRSGGRLVIVDFIYTHCEFICRSLGSEFQRLQSAIVERGLQDRVHLLSVSFDPERDRPDALARHAGHLQAMPEVWTFATVRDATELDGLLNFFGVTVIPDGLGGYQHNAALLWVSPTGRYYRVTDLESQEPFELLDRLAGQREPVHAAR